MRKNQYDNMALYGTYPYQYYRSRHYQKSGRYNANSNANETTRTVVNGAITIGALALFGGLVGGMTRR